MNKRKILLPNRPVFALFLRLFACVPLLLACGVYASTTNQTSQITGSATGSVTNQDLTDMSLEQLMQIQVPVVESASRFEQKATEAPASATVITSDEIKKYGWRTLGDLLETLPGFYVSYDRDYDYLGVSGVNIGDANNRVLLLVNGHRLNNDLNDSAPIDTSFILDVDLIDRVEIIRGPGSVLYGNNAFFAVINVITRTGKQVNGVEGSGAYGSYNAGTGRVTIGGSFTNGLQFLLSGTAYNNDGPGNLNFPPAGTAHNMDRDSFDSFFGSVNYYDFTLEGGYIDRFKVNPTGQYFGTTFNNALLHTEDWRSYAMLKVDHHFPDDWDVSGDVYYDRSDFEIGWPGLPAPPQFEVEKQTGQWAGTEVLVTKKIMDKHVLSFGGEYRNDFDQNANIYTNNVLTETLRQHRHNYGIFGQGDFAILDNLHLDAGVRYDQYGEFTPSWSPRAAIIYNPWQQTTFKFIYGTAFRDPNFIEQSDSSFVDIKPERITSYDLIYEQGINRYLRSSVSGYYNRLDNLISRDQFGGFQNIQADTWGLDVALDGKWLDKIDTRLSYSLQHTVDRATDKSLPDSPLNMIKLNINAPLYQDKIFAGLEIQYTGPSKTIVTTPFRVPGPNAPGYAVVNFTLFSQNLIKNLDVSASVYNLFNTKYYEPSSDFHFEPYIQQNGINFRVKLTYRF